MAVVISARWSTVLRAVGSTPWGCNDSRYAQQRHGSDGVQHCDVVKRVVDDGSRLSIIVVIEEEENECYRKAWCYSSSTVGPSSKLYTFSREES